MAYSRRSVTDGVTVMNKELYDNLQDGIDESKEDLEGVKENVSEVENQVEITTSIVKGRNRAKVFLTTEKMKEWLSNPENKKSCNIGDNLYIIDIGVPDWWVSEVLNEVDQETGYYYKIAQLETQKVDLTTIEESLILLENCVANVTDDLSTDDGYSFKVGKDENGNLGYVVKNEGGADTVRPFRKKFSTQNLLPEYIQKDIIVEITDGIDIEIVKGNKSDDNSMIMAFSHGTSPSQTISLSLSLPSGYTWNIYDSVKSSWNTGGGYSSNNITRSGHTASSYQGGQTITRTYTFSQYGKEHVSYSLVLWAKPL